MFPVAPTRHLFSQPTLPACVKVNGRVAVAVAVNPYAYAHAHAYAHALLLARHPTRHAVAGCA